MWVIRFRYISDYDYFTPLMYIPIEETRIEADTADEAWDKWINNSYAGNPNNYRRIEIFKDSITHYDKEGKHERIFYR